MASPTSSSPQSVVKPAVPTLQAHDHSRYLFTQPNTFAYFLRPKTETQVGSRLEAEDVTATQFHQRLAGA